MNTQKILVVASSLAFFAACSSAPPPPPPKAMTKAPPKPKVVSPAQMMEAGNKKMASGDYAAAIKSYEGILAKQPKDPAANYNKALAQYRMGDVKSSEAGFRTALMANPKDADAALSLGAALRAQDKNPEAIKVYEDALKNHPFHGGLLNNLANLYRAEGQYDKAVEALRTVLKRDQNNVDAYKNLALVYYDQKKYKLTQTILENARKMGEEQKRKDPDIWVNLGMIKLAQKDNGAAMARFKKALEIDPKNVPANYNIGSLALQHRDYKLAAKSYEVVQKEYPDDYRVAANLGFAYQGQQQLEPATAQLEKARELKKKNGGQYKAASTPVSGEELEEQMILQLMIIKQAAEDNAGALKYADQYMALKGLNCGPDDYDGFCGRVNGIKLMIQMEKEAAAAPPPEEEAKPKAGQVDVFTDAPAEEDVEGAEGAEGAAPAEGGETPPAEGEAPNTEETKAEDAKPEGS